ncbi:MAG: AAA family ATPase [Sulfurimonas sp.]|jgi:replicative DNA helicase
MNNLFDFNYEITLLSSLIFSEESIKNIDSDIFYYPIHKSILLTLLSLEQQNLPRDEILIHNHLIKTLKLDENLVANSMIDVLSATPTSNHQAYLDRLIELKRIRNVKTSLLDIQIDIQENKTADEIEASLLSISEKLVTKSGVELFKMIPASYVEAKESDFITKNFIPVPKKTVSIFSAGGGTGKTSLLLQLAMHYLYENQQEKAFCWLSEDPLGLTKHRLNHVIAGLYPLGAETLHRLILSDDLTFPILLEQNRNMTINSHFYKMKMMLKEFKLIILDPLIAFYGGDENNNAQAKLFMQLFTKWASEEDKTIIFIHHSTKNTSQSRGASAFVDAARAVYEIEKIKDEDGKEVDTTKRKITLTKDNYRASKHFDGFSKQIQVFPNEDSTKNHQPAFVVEYTSDEELGIQ